MQMCSRCFSALMSVSKTVWRVCWDGVAEAGVINLNFHAQKLKHVSQRGTSGQRITQLFFWGLDLRQTQPPFRENFKNRNQILSEEHNPVLLCLLPFAFWLPSAPDPRAGVWPYCTPRMMTETKRKSQGKKIAFSCKPGCVPIEK